MTTLNDRYEVLYHLARKLHLHHLDPQHIAQSVVAMTGEAIGVQFGCLMTFHDNYSIEQAYILGADDSATAAGADLWNQLLKHGLVGFVRHGERTVVVRNINADPRWPRLFSAPFIPAAGSAIGLPLQHHGQVFGVLMFVDSRIDAFDHDRVGLLEEVGEIAAAALGNAIDFHATRFGDGHYRTMFEDAITPIILTDLDGMIVDANQVSCDFLRRERGDLRRLPITAIHPMAEDLLHERLAALNRDEEVVFRTSARIVSGEDVPVTIRTRRLKLGRSEVIEWVEQDVTAQMELEQLRRDLSAMVYHDLRGPLQTIKGSINKLGQVLANHDNPAVWTLLQVGVRSVRQLQRMVDGLLDIQRIEEGKAVLDLHAVEVRVILADAAQLVQPLAIEANQRLQFELNGDLPLVLMDSDMIIRVVTNLMENAIKYTPDGGVIMLGAHMTEEGVRISVRDSGPGIPPEMKTQVFDKFSRVKYKDAPKGVGLGLAFCRLAVEAHGGRIWVESEPGRGAEFIFTLPPDKIAVEDEQYAAV